METKKNSVVIALIGEFISQEIKHLQNVKRFHGAYLYQSKTGLAILFNYGVIVFWGVEKDERERIIRKIAPFTITPTKEITLESYTFNIDPSKPYTIKNDHLLIPDNSPIVRLALSHALAQSVKLIYFEDTAEEVISTNLHITKKLAQTGKINMSRKDLSKLRGILFDTSCDISLHFNLLDKPNFFWDFPELDEYYEKLSKYLEMNQRISLLNHKLSMIRELLAMLAEEQNHKHSSFLEWIIIILIALEIVLFIFTKALF